MSYTADLQRAQKTIQAALDSNQTTEVIVLTRVAKKKWKDSNGNVHRSKDLQGELDREITGRMLMIVDFGGEELKPFAAPADPIGLGGVTAPPDTDDVLTGSQSVEEQKLNDSWKL